MSEQQPHAKRPPRENIVHRLISRVCYHAVMRLNWDECQCWQWRYRAWLWLLPWAGYYAFAPSSAQGDTQ